MSKKYHVTIRVNGDEYEYLCEPQQTLLDALRDELMLTGTKEGCATGDCGACTVMVDDTMVCSCLVLAVEAEGTKVETIEGMAKGEIIVSLLFPPRPAHASDAYLRFTPRTEMDIAVVGVGINLVLDGSGTCTVARVALGAVAPTVLLVKECADALIGSKVDALALERLAAAASAACRPIDDKRGTKEYRIKVAAVMARRAAEIALERARRKN